MGKNTRISWSDHTFNPWWGCTRISPGCDNCYADAWARRTGLKLWDGGPRRFSGQKYWAEPLKWNAAAAAAGVRHRVFCGSMCDVFEAAPSAELDAPRERLWELIDQTPQLDWLLLTKRPENMPTLAPHAWADGWPENVWAMTTVENQELARPRIEALSRVPAATLGLSMEPLLGRVVLPYLRMQICWVVIGCEKMSGNRPGRHCDLSSVRSLIAQSHVDGAKVFVKQLEIDGHVSANPADWPEDLRIQEFPQ